MAASVYVPITGAALTNADVTKNPASDGVSEYQLPAATLTADHTLTLGTSGSPAVNDVIRIVRLDATAHSYIVANGGGGGGTLFTFGPSPTAVFGASFYWDGANWRFLSTYPLVGVHAELEGSALTDASTTVNPGSDAVSQYVLPAATLTTNRTLTIGTSGSPVTGSLVRIVRQDLTGNTYAIANGGGGGGTIFTFGATPTKVTALTVFFNGSDWVLVGFQYLKA
jgi:hypothetical protein